MENTKQFTVLKLWQERGFPDIPILMIYAGRNIAASYKARRNTLPEKIKVCENKSWIILVNQYPADFRSKANGILNRIQAKYKGKHPREPKEKQIRVKRIRVKTNNVKICY